MNKNKYISLVTNLNSLLQKHKELEEIYKDASFDLKWRLSELFKSVEVSDEEKFIKISGMENHLTTSKEKNNIPILEKRRTEEKISEKNEFSFKENVDKPWAKKLYKKAVKRCHPDMISVNDKNYQKILEDIYKEIVSSFDRAYYDNLMVSCYKLLLTPEHINSDQINILERSTLSYQEKINQLMSTQEIVWYHFKDDMKENFLVNLMKQNGVKFINRDKIREVIKRNVSRRKAGKKPINNLKLRVKDKNK